jgi:7,8-dihydropterin-6-yl-methyl-4-(beta-D-ribofuranosyl)aminobenzene 5'-phosphate synthase
VPRPATGSAIDPIALEPVDEIVITTLVDNVYDGLLTSDDRSARAPLSAGLAEAPQFETGLTAVGLVAEHGFSALVSVRRGTSTTRLLFGTGISPDAMVTNAGRLGADLSQIQAVVLSHGHFDHTGGLAGLAGPGRRRGGEAAEAGRAGAGTPPAPCGDAGPRRQRVLRRTGPGRHAGVTAQPAGRSTNTPQPR